MEELSLINRRSFVKNFSLAGMALPLVPSKIFNEKQKTEKLTILHTNDMHSHIDPFSKNDSNYPSMGGMTRIAQLVNRIRTIEDHVLFLDAGDIFQGTPYFNRFKGTLELKLMSEMKYHASTMGNHDFDNGIDGFNSVLHHANFPFLCSNYDFSNTIMDGKTIDYKTISFNKFKVGIFGIGIELEGLVQKKLYRETKYLDPIEIANHWAEYLKLKEKCHLVICLSHLGYSYKSEKISDLKLAEKTKNIDLIIGGHTHTFLEKANVVNNLENKKVIINQAGWGALSLGRIDLFFNSNGQENDDLSHNIFPKKNYAKI
tara:strand:+ start:2125 stop:3072 length:948 start_codon:yes stop_codon:yes gene_type:complete